MRRYRRIYMTLHDDICLQSDAALKDIARRVQILADETLALSQRGKGVWDRKGREAFYDDVHDLVADLFSVAFRMKDMYTHLSRPKSTT
jgi:hypothetical protein